MARGVKYKGLGERQSGMRGCEVWVIKKAYSAQMHVGVNRSELTLMAANRVSSTTSILRSLCSYRRFCSSAALASSFTCSTAVKEFCMDQPKCTGKITKISTNVSKYISKEDPENWSSVFFFLSKSVKFFLFIFLEEYH